MKQLIIFKINNTQDIIIKNLCSEGGHLYRYDPIEIIFKNENIEYIISQNDHLMPELETFYYYLKDGIEYRLQLLDTINDNLGYLWNQDLHNTSIKNYEELKNEESWKGQKYLMWSGRGISTWLYNNNGSIILEITPTYPWHFSDTKKDENFISYDEWMKNYKSIIKIKISKETAQEWLAQAGKIMQEIEKNDEKYLHAQE